MSIEQLELILCDMYQMDAWTPPLRFKWKNEFDEACYSRWALNELKEYIAKGLYPRAEGSLHEICALTKEFTMKMARYARTNKKSRLIFQSAYKVAADVLDLLHAMM